MRARKEKDKIWYFLSFLLGLTMIFLFIFWSSKLMVGKKKIEEKIDKLQENINILKTKNEELKMRVNNIDNQKYIEEKAREQGFQKPDEESVIINKKNE